MQQQKCYVLPGFLKSVLLNGDQRIYIFILNQIQDMKEVSLMMNQYLSTINAFHPYTWVICNQQPLPLEINGVKQILSTFCKYHFQFIERNIPLQQVQRIEKLIVISDQIQFTQLANLIPSLWQSCLTNKVHLILRYREIICRLNQIISHNIELTQNQVEFLSRINSRYQEEVPFYGKDISEYPKANTGVPECLEAILQYYERHDDYLRKQGVFRTSGSVQQEQKLIQQFKVRNYSVLEDYDPDVVSTVFKNLLSQLKTPIFPFEMYDILKETQINTSVEKLLEMFQVFFAYMPEVNRKTTKRIAELLYHVANYESENLMGLHNLSIVFAPCFLRPEQTDISDFHGAITVAHHFNLLVQNVEFFVQQLRANPQQVQRLT
ncbi:unnamed protein product [Paramecium octaurelia]|uniref:Rho-GAP domain-containing protein n=1 Tax=Paramecium octaurelia TaxID=43137 RepID=A0A8S1SBP4_PAROT|nr:unnamed protein product [Paramecium octaurelia]